MYKAVIVLALAVYVNAGGVYLDHHVGATAEQTVRGYGGLSSLSHQAKTVNSAYSTASAYKTKATNNALLAAPAYAHAVGPAYAAPVAHAYAAPAQYASPYGHAYAAPAYAQPIAHALPVAHAPVAHAVAAPVAHAYAAPAQYASPYGHAVAAPAYAHPIARALPVAHAPAIAKAGLLGVAYSPVAPGVATLHFDGFGVHYGY